MTKLLSIASDVKTIKGQQGGYLTAIMYLQPDFDLCPKASKGCMASCLQFSGRMPMAKKARIKRTLLFKNDRLEFFNQLIKEIKAFIKRANKKGLTPVIRLNGTSDINWARTFIPKKAVSMPDGQLIDRGLSDMTIFDYFPKIQFYDYTPNLEYLNQQISPGRFNNYHLTFSLKENNLSDAYKAIDRGFNVAVVFRDNLPKRFLGRPVFDGDQSDLRFKDPGKRLGQLEHVIGLLAKGRAKKDKSGFVKDTKFKSPILYKIGA